MIAKGNKIDTNFSLDIVTDGDEKEVTFSELLNRPTIVSVYMRNNTSGCDRQNQSLAENAGWFDDKGFNLIGLSKDSCGSHKNYSKKLGINYILASDPDFKFAKATDSVVEKKMYGKTFDAPSRSAFVIDIDGTVLEVIEKIDTKAHANELKELVESI
ncbi:MAG TPA: redoxin domain-containing protein [Balneolaceae bacterium]|nr:redoxin domain-containing protein [Balneolaceae bacterium]